MHDLAAQTCGSTMAAFASSKGLQYQTQENSLELNATETKLLDSKGLGVVAFSTRD